jgi:hypothetical protein
LADLKNSSPLKMFGQMYRNLVGSIYGKSSVAIAYVVLIRLQTWLKNCFFQKAYNHKHELPVAAMFVNESGRNEQSL